MNASLRMADIEKVLITYFNKDLESYVDEMNLKAENYPPFMKTIQNVKTVRLIFKENLWQMKKVIFTAFITSFIVYSLSFMAIYEP